MNREIERINNARRLAYALYQRSGDDAAVKQLARILHYMPDQLRIDMQDLEAFTAKVEDSERFFAEAPDFKFDEDLKLDEE